MDDYSRIFDLSGRRAFVVGGASGIGRAACFGLASFGAQVTCGDIKAIRRKRRWGKYAKPASPPRR